jgi:DNA-directed RNA polymerase I, II, and III subunit RPABC2
MSVNYSDNESLYDSSSDSDSEIIKPKTKKQSVPTIEDEEDDVLEIENSDDESENENVVESEEDEPQIGGGNDSELEEGEIQEDEEEEEDEEQSDNENTENKTSQKQAKTKINIQPVIDDDDDDDEYDENYLQKFDAEITKNYIADFHPECFNHNYEEIAKLSTVVKNSDNIIIDPFHKTIPFLTKYEKTRILGQRAKQIEMGAKPFINVDEKIVDSYIIAELELREKKIPFIIKRPLPSGGFEYWRVTDLEIIY